MDAPSGGRVSSSSRTLTDADLAALRVLVGDVVREVLSDRAARPATEPPANEPPPTPRRGRKRDLSHVVPTDMDYALAAQVQRRLGIVPKRR